MRFLYDVLVPLGALAAAPAYLLRSLRHPAYRSHLGERFGRLPADLVARLDRLEERRPVWIQAVSVGEVLLAQTLISALDKARGADEAPLPVVISSTTPAGRDAALSIRTPGVLGIFHFPIDWAPFVRSAHDTLRPAAFLLAEAEIWPAHLGECARREIPVILVNGRVSERSRRNYARAGGLFREALQAVRLACVQSAQDAERIASLGVPDDRILVTGNMKFDAAAPSGSPEDLRALYDLPSNGGPPVLVAGSTSPGEESMLLDALARLPDDLVLVLAPRHRERFDEVSRLLQKRGIPFTRRTRLPGRQGRVILLDTMGELGSVYALATVAFVGGSLVPRGGQNLIEPAAAGVPVLFGPHTENFSTVAESLLEAGAGYRVDDGGGLAATISTLIADPDRRREAGRAGIAATRAHRGATARTVSGVRALLAGED